VNNLLRKYYELFYKFDVERLSGLSDEYKVLVGEIEELMLKSDDVLLLNHLHHVVLKAADFSSSTYALHS
jgi:hypothetical protein